MTRLLTFFMASALLLPLALAGNARAEVNDAAGLFSPQAIAQADTIIGSFRAKYRKTIRVDTINQAASVEAVERTATANSREVNGIYILISRKPPRVEARTNSDTAKLFTSSIDTKIAETIIAGFKKKDFDGGLMAGLSLIEKTAAGASAAQPAGPVQIVKTTARPAGGFSFSSLGCFGWILIALAIWVVIGVVLAFTMPRQPMGPPMQPGMGPAPGYGPNYGGGYNYGGGGFGSSLLGGLFGAMAGNWIYNSMWGGGMTGMGGNTYVENNYTAAPGGMDTTPQDAGPAGWTQPDDGSNVVGGGGDWGGADTGDTGDTVGGGDFGGGDFGGGDSGGDSGGGGGGDW